MASSKTTTIAPQSLNASLRLREERFLPPFLPSRCACALEASQTRPRVRPGLPCTRARPRRVQPRWRGPSVGRSGSPDDSRALSARLTSAATGLARLLVLARRRPSLKRSGGGAGAAANGGYEAGGGSGTAAKDKAVVRAPSDPTGGGGPSANRLGSKPPLGPGSGERPSRPSLPSGVAFAPVAMAPQGTGSSGSSSSAAASPSRTFRELREGGGGDPTTLPTSAGSPSSHAAGGGGARRTKREERGRRGGGLGAEGPRPGLGRPKVRSEAVASDWWSTGSFQYASGLAEPLGPATKWRRGRGSWEVAQRALLVTARTEL